VAAKLINLPAAIFTDSFVYINPSAYMAYGIEKEIDADVDNRIIQYLNDDQLQTTLPAESLIENLGHIQCFSILDGETQRKCLIPTVMLYEFCPQELEFMNRTEFECLVHSAKKRDKKESSKNVQFEFSPESGLGSCKALFLSAKQRIPIFTRPVPPHPGTKPIQNGAAFLRWKEKADAYAHYFLMMYWPEPLTKQNVPLEYTWNAFQEWINKERESNTAFGICRLMMMHRRMQTTYTDNQMQQVFNDYRTAPRDLWSSETRNRIATTFQREYQQKNEELEDEQWNLSNSELSALATTQLQNLLKFSDMQLKSLQYSTIRVRDYVNGT